ncbi:MAG: restriction endonuclease subunit S [Treponema sp.]|nr:restriction endonuclease subunit S [Treponema sp.]
MVEQSSILRTVPFKDFSKWDVKRFFIKQIQSSYPVLFLSELLNEETEKKKLSKFPKEVFGILGVSNEVGMFDAYTEMGSNIKQPYKIVKNDFIAYNPYRVNVGSIGIKKASLKNDYISNAYVVFSTKEKLLADYLYLLMHTPRFNQLIRDNTTGSVRQTLSFENLCKIAVPVPTITEQNSILQKYQEIIAQANKLESKAEELSQNISNELINLLGITVGAKSEKNHSVLTFVKYSKCSRWDVDYILGKHSVDYIFTSKYPIINTRNIILSCQYGSSSKADKNSNNTPVLRMNNIQDGEFNINDLKYLNLSQKDLTTYKLNKGDLLFNRTNSKELVGKTAVFEYDGDYVFASYLIRVVIDSTKANVHYINYLFGSQIIRDQINSISRQITGQANVNAEELKDLIFPLPPLPIQNKIVSHINQIKKQVKDLNEKAKDLREQAKKEFEGSVFE